MGNRGYLCSTCRRTLEEATISTTKAERLKRRTEDYFSASPPSQGVYPHHKDLIGFRNSLRENCYICSRLSAWYTNGFKDSEMLRHRCEIEVEPRPDISERPRKIQIWFYGEWTPDYSVVSYFEAIEDPQKLGQVAKISRMSEERSSFQLAKKWLSACLETHLLCQAESNDILPTRLVKTERVGSELTARLCNGSDLSRNTKYITLSHCWGKGPQFFLQRDNMNQMEQSIPVKDLSPLFQDALIATYELGFKYIWIDSLCIVQDSPGSSDWVKESSKMHHVYGNSICNLSATGYADGQTGLLQSTQGDITDLIPPEVNFARLLGQQSDSIYTIVSSQDWDREIVDSPVNRRGWICQEQIMAPRIIHFTRRQLYWECCEAVESETVHNRMLNTVSFHGIKKRIHNLTPQFEFFDIDFYSQWRQVINLYCKAALTYGSDKLPALSGLAKIFMAKLQDDYLAGLWKKDLLYGLLWDGHLNGTTAPVYRAPSWSWASVDGPIQYHIVDGPILYHVKDKHRQLYPLAQVLESFTTIANRDDITAEVKDGYIRLSGHLQRIQLSNAPESIGCSYTDYKWNFGLKKGSGSTESLDELIFTGTPAGSQAADLCISLSARNAYKNSQVFLMPLLDNKTTDGPYSVFGLALYPVEGFIGAYTKFGVFGMSRGCQECVFHTETKLGEQYFERIDGLDKYVVKIV